MNEAMESIGRAMQDALRASVNLRGEISRMPASLSSFPAGKLIMGDGTVIPIGEVEMRVETAVVEGDDGIITRASQPSSVTIHAAEPMKWSAIAGHGLVAGGGLEIIDGRIERTEDFTLPEETKREIIEELHTTLYEALEEVEKTWSETKGKVEIVDKMRDVVDALVYENTQLKSEVNKMKVEHNANISRISILEHEMWDNRKKFDMLIEEVREMRKRTEIRNSPTTPAHVRIDR